ncbi:MAG: hypothetical protein ABW171_15525 [Steroidobacter sp.]
MRNILIVVFAVLSALGNAVVRADDSYREQMKGLDEQVQEVKSDVLSIAAELKRLEERLLYPSNTHLAVFVELAERDTLRLDAVRVQIDGQLVAHTIYSFKELEALQRGGVQRIYTGNVTTGAHQMEVSIAGKLDSGKEYTRSERFDFTKGIEPKLIGVTLGSSELRLGDW